MERYVTVRTPEAIAFSYELAGLGSRFLALLTDSVIQGTALALLFISGLIGSSRGAQLARAMNLNQKTAESLLLALTILVLFAVFCGYFVAFEAYWQGQTPGKRLLGIRVVKDGGYPIDLTDSLIRNLIRILELSVGFYCISAISMLVSSENKRLGDYAAGTIVVRAGPMEIKDRRNWMRSEGSPESSWSDAFGKLTGEELAVVERYAQRKSALEPRAARDAAARIAAALRPKLDPSLAALGDDELLTRIAARN